MGRILHPLFALLASVSRRDLARQVAYLKEENRILRARLPERLVATATSVPLFVAANGDWMRATPAFDGESLFVAGMRDVLACLDAARGKSTPTWQLPWH
jgi:hypothetical protein